MTWVVMIAVGIGSYLLRVLPLFVGGRYLGSPRAERIIAQAGTAALTALIASGLHHSASSSTDFAPTWLSAAAALAVAVRGGSMQRVLAAGAIAYAAVWAAMALIG
jgi:branched-subunit amino acid transport protein